MSVRLIIGRSGTGKTSKCLEEIKDKLLENPKGNPILYIVPDQMTFLSEYQLIQTPWTWWNDSSASIFVHPSSMEGTSRNGRDEPLSFK